MDKMDRLEIVFHISVMTILAIAVGALAYGTFVISQIYLKILGA